MNALLEGLGVEILGAVVVFLCGSAMTLAWQRFSRATKKGRVSRLLGVQNGGGCVISLNRSPRDARRVAGGAPGTQLMTHNDSSTVFELYKLLDRMGIRIDLFEPDVGNPPEDVLEICIGGIRANPRSERLLKNYLPNIKMENSSDPEAPQSFRVSRTLDPTRRSGYLLPCERGVQEYAILATISREGAGPLLLIVGQTSISNLAAARYLRENVDSLSREFPDGSMRLLLLVQNSGGIDPRTVLRLSDKEPDLSLDYP